MCHLFALVLRIVVSTGKMPRRPRMKNTNRPAPIASQFEGYASSEASGFEVQLNVTPAKYSPRTTRL